MAQAIIDQKLESLRRCVARIETRCLPPSVIPAKAGIQWPRTPAAPQTMAQSFTALAGAHKIDEQLAARLRKTVGFRNIMVHNYQTVNWDIVFALCQERLADFRTFAARFVSCQS